MLYSKEISIWEVAVTAASDGSSLSTAPSVAVLCLLTKFPILWIRNSNTDDHRHGAIEGYCDNIGKGNIRIGINIGNCPGYGNANGDTGWMSVSRLVIEEVSQSQQ